MLELYVNDKKICDIPSMAFTKEIDSPSDEKPYRKIGLLFDWDEEEDMTEIRERLWEYLRENNPIEFSARFEGTKDDKRYIAEFTADNLTSEDGYLYEFTVDRDLEWKVKE